MSDVGLFSDAQLMLFVAALFAGVAGVCWLIVVFGKRETVFQARWNGIAAIFAAIASGLMAGSALMS